MEKRGVVDHNTPAQTPKPATEKKPTEKQAADQQEEHLATRMSDAVKDAKKK